MRLLLILHAIAGAVVCGASTHHLLWARRRLGVASTRRFAALTLWAYGAGMGLGLVMYPVYRTEVRARYLDAALPWLSRLFDCKEHVAAVGLSAAIGAFVLSRRLDAAQGPFAAPLYLTLAGAACLCGWFVAVVGLVAVSYRSFG